MLTPEQLMKPRYKVISNYPNSIHTIEDIIENKDGDIVDVIAYYNCSYYPNIFQKLEWWEQRNVEDMPEYVRWNPKSIPLDAIENEVMRIESSRECNPGGSMAGMIEFILDRGDPKLNKYGYQTMMLPATEEQYNQYLNSKQ